MSYVRRMSVPRYAMVRRLGLRTTLNRTHLEVYAKENILEDTGNDKENVEHRHETVIILAIARHG